MMVVAGLSYLANSFTLILAPEYYKIVFPLLVLCLIAELSLSLWLIFKGVNISKWDVVVSQTNDKEI